MSNNLNGFEATYKLNYNQSKAQKKHYSLFRKADQLYKRPILNLIFIDVDFRKNLKF